METFPLAILPLPNVVLFPNTIIPMLIVEPTYVKMVRDCLVTEQSIGISMAEPIEERSGSPRYSPQRVATMGKPILLEEHEDGSLKILVKGEQRIELISVEQNIPYLIYKVRTIPDIRESSAIAFESPHIERLKEILDNWMEDTIEDSLERETFLQTLNTLHHIMDYLAMFMVADRHIRQLLLENRSLHERIQMLSSLLRGEYPDCEDTLVVNAIKDFEYGEMEHYFVH
ncbi:MAG: LON peptidase substrate-binding domain-containing protein [Bacteriovoracaceae bacterium]|nr:LON peptidase substrate-binding domain-containing protein [Bacteriovoracaceae bacterium]